MSTFNPSKLQAFLKTKGKTPLTGARTGGKGTVRRKHKIIRKAATHDDKRLKTTLNKLNVRDIPAIEEVNLFKDDGTVVHFAAPKVQASIAANTYVVSGTAETKKLQDLLPGIINQLGPDNLEDLKKIYATYSQAEAPKGGEDEDDEVPELVSNFEDVSEDKEKDGDKPTKAEPKAESKPKSESKPKDSPKAEPTDEEDSEDKEPKPKSKGSKKDKEGSKKEKAGSKKEKAVAPAADSDEPAPKKDKKESKKEKGSKKEKEGSKKEKAGSKKDKKTSAKVDEAEE